MAVVKNGYYWCSHDTGKFLAEGERYPAQWHVVHIDGDWFSMTGGEVELRLSEMPDYVRFVGPLEPPSP